MSDNPDPEAPMGDEPYIINVADIVNPATGKTWREENMELTHKIPLWTLVEIDSDYSEDNGARLWVVEHNRDCDGEPLYSLACKEVGESWIRARDSGSELATLYSMALNHGWSEGSLKVIEYPDGFEIPDGDGGAGC